MDQPATMLYLLLLLSHVISFVTSAAHSQKSFPYLYATINDPNASYPVIDHISPEHRGLDKDTVDLPSFLYGDTNGYRIVEYYIHWCNTCRLFAPVYTKFARKVTEMAAVQGVSIKIYAVNCSPNRKLCLEQKAKDYPKIRFYRPNETEFHHELGHHFQLHPYSTLDALGITYDPIDGAGDEDAWDVEKEMDKGDSVASHSPMSWFQRGLSYIGLTSSVNYVNDVDHRRSRDDLKADISLSFDYALRHDIFRSNEPLSKEESKVFREWLELLLLSIPSSWGMADLLHELINNYIYVAKSRQYMMAVLDEFPPSTDTWSLSCSKGRPGQGYTCGLWELLHAVTVGVVEYNEASFDEENVRSVEDVARILRDYVEHFFGCVTCREHFVRMYDSCDLDRCQRLSGNQWRQLPLWLFETHNAVNVRLAKGKDTAKWPKPKDCSLCWNSNGTYDADVAYLYLKHEYGQRTPATGELRRKLANATHARHQVEPQQQQQTNSASLVERAPFVGLVAMIVLLLSGWASHRRKEKLE